MNVRDALKKFLEADTATAEVDVQPEVGEEAPTSIDRLPKLTYEDYKRWRLLELIWSVVVQQTKADPQDKEMHSLLYDVSSSYQKTTEVVTQEIKEVYIAWIQFHFGKATGAIMSFLQEALKKERILFSLRMFGEPPTHHYKLTFKMGKFKYEVKKREALKLQEKYQNFLHPGEHPLVGLYWLTHWDKAREVMNQVDYQNYLYDIAGSKLESHYLNFGRLSTPQGRKEFLEFLKRWVTSWYIDFVGIVEGILIAYGRLIEADTLGWNEPELRAKNVAINLAMQAAHESQKMFSHLGLTNAQMKELSSLGEGGEKAKELKTLSRIDWSDARRVRGLFNSVVRGTHIEKKGVRQDFLDFVG